MQKSLRLKLDDDTELRFRVERFAKRFGCHLRAIDGGRGFDIVRKDGRALVRCPDLKGFADLSGI